MKRFWKWLGIAILTPILLLILLAILLYLPPVQNWAVKRVAAIASEKTGMQISVQHVNLSFPLDLGIDGILVMQQNDTVADIQSAVVDVKLMPLLRQEVVVQGLDIRNAKVNTLDKISDVQIKGFMGQFSLDPSDVLLATGDVNLSTATLADADVTVLLSDTAAADTTESGPALWRIQVEAIDILRSKVDVHLPGDSMTIGVLAGTLRARDGIVDLAKEYYAVGALDWTEGALRYDLPYEPRLQDGTMDYSHIAATDITLGIDSFAYRSPDIRMYVRQAALREQSGLTVKELKGPVYINDQGVQTSGLFLRTPSSSIYTTAKVDFSVADDNQPGQMDVTLDASVGKEDIAVFAPIDRQLMKSLPEWPLQVKGSVSGNLKQARVTDMDILWPTLVKAQADGTLRNLTDTERLWTQLDVSVQTFNTQPLLAALGIPATTLVIPGDLTMQGRVSTDGPRYGGDVTLALRDNSLKINGFYDTKDDSYQADAAISSLNLKQFLPDVPLSLARTNISVKGRGTDFTRTDTRLDAESSVGSLRYDTIALSNIHLMASLHDGHAIADVSSANDVMNGSFCLDALLSHDKRYAGQITTAINQLNLTKLGISDVPLTIALTSNLKIESDLNQTHYVSGLIESISLRDSVGTYLPENIGVLISTAPDTTKVRLQNGNLIVKADARGGYEKLLGQITALADTVASNLHQGIINQDRLKQMLPVATLQVTSGRDNSMAKILKSVSNISFRDLSLNLTTSPENGANGQMEVYGLDIDSTLIDTVTVSLRDMGRGQTFQARVANNKKNPQFVFTSMIDGILQERGLSAGVRFYDDKGRLGLRLGTKAEMEQGGLRFHLLPERPVIGYREFKLNSDHFVFLQNNMRLQANVSLTADDGTGVSIYSEDQDSTLLQDLTVTLNRLDLGQITASIPYVPRITGMLDGDYHLMMDGKKQISVASDMVVNNMTYENCPMGNLGAEFVYMQREDDTHAVEGTLLQNDRQIALLSGSYRNKKATGGDEHLEAAVNLTKMPLAIVNGFIPDQIIGFEGNTSGKLSVVGSLDAPDVNGRVTLDSAYLVSQPYGVKLRFDNTPVVVEHSKMQLDEFKMYGYNDTPLTITGNVDFSDADNKNMDIRLRAQNFLLINGKRTAKSEAYGKAYVNLSGSLRGPLDRLSMRGRMDVLGSTDLTYLLLDSPLSTDNSLDELVKFVDFDDSTKIVVQRPEPDGFKMNMTINIDQGAHVLCGLNSDLSNYVDFFGGGTLRMAYNNIDGLQLNGRYTLSNGQMKYSMPVIPLKTFNIQDGSYVEFTGDPMNPTLNITATERTKAAVSEDDGKMRSVAFDCGVVITRTLNDMGLQFIISSPEDMSVAGELSLMTAEQRGKLAVTMLTTGMYLADGNTSGFSMNSALSSFLQNEINNITGNALKTIDVSFGLDNATDASGAMQTDYSFKFAKRFWNNRLKVQIGGRVSTGTEIQGKNQSFFDNVTMEYRLSPTANQYVKLFYNQNVYDWLDGYTGEYGGGFIWRRKLDTLWDIFRFKSAGTAQNGGYANRPNTQVSPNDSIRRNRNDSISTNR